MTKAVIFRCALRFPEGATYIFSEMCSCVFRFEVSSSSVCLSSLFQSIIVCSAFGTLRRLLCVAILSLSISSFVDMQEMLDRHVSHCADDFMHCPALDVRCFSWLLLLFQLFPMRLLRLDSACVSASVVSSVKMLSACVPTATLRTIS